jgi:hypothetical protein
MPPQARVGRVSQTDSHGARGPMLIRAPRFGVLIRISKSWQPSLRGAKRRSNPSFIAAPKLDCFASLAMTTKHIFAISRRDSRF